MLSESINFNPFAGPELESVVYTTKAQSEIWTACYFGGSDAARAYNESISMDFTGSLDSTAMSYAIQMVVSRHDALRATFSTDGIYMSIYKESTLELVTVDLSDLEEIAKKKALDQYISDDAYFLFDLVTGPLFKVGLLKLSENNHLLVITAHHIICDGWSLGIILQDLGAIYSAYVENKTPILTEAIPFSIYANNEKIFSESDENKEIEKFWYEIYENSIPVVDVPTDYPRPSLRTFKCQRLDFALDPNLLAELKQTGLSVGSSLVTTLLTSFEVFLYQLTGQEDLVVGLPYAGQPAAEMNNLIGHCVSLLPLRSKPISNICFIDYLKQRKSQLLDAYEHSQLSFGHLLQKLNVSRDPSRIPLVPIVFNIDLGMTDGVHFSDLIYTHKSNPRAHETFEIFLNAIGSVKNLVFEWSYNEALFKPETIKKMMASFEKIIQKIIEDPSKTLEQITYQDFSSEYNELNATTANYPNVTLNELFTIQAQKTPNEIAVVYKNQKLTYNELNNLSNQLANYLINMQEIVLGDLVGIMLDRSELLIVCIIGILKSGAAYIPIDFENPQQRSYIQNDSKCKITIDYRMIEDFIQVKDNFSEEAPVIVNLKPDSLCYIIYTSGTTGKPKGVMIEHQGVVNLILHQTKNLQITKNENILLFSNYCFDASIEQIFIALLNGNILSIISKEEIKNHLLLPFLENNKITHLDITPSYLETLGNISHLKSLKRILVGGEVCSLKLARKLGGVFDFYNCYGPTENSITSTIFKYSAESECYNSLPIGKPISNTTAYILSDTLRLKGIGEIGELCLAGKGLARGYLNLPELTAQKFINNPFLENSKLYKTGDLAKLLPNGDIEYIGRRDNQIKIRGYRIELEGIESKLLNIDEIKSAVVLTENDRLIAYIILNNNVVADSIKIKEWKKELLNQLPEYCVPYNFKIIKILPTTSNGKIDKEALLKEECLNIISITQITEPRTESEKLVATVWKECLNLEQIDVFSNFFEIGGHSLIAVKVMNNLDKITGKQIHLSALFEHSTIEKFAKLIDANNETHSDCIVPVKPNGNKIPLFIIHGAGLNVLNFAHLSRYFDEDQPIYGIQGTGSKGYDEWYESIESMAAHYIDAIVKINPNGPYALAGFSFGGVVAFEMTRQLKKNGKTVSLTALLDSYLDSSYYYKTLNQKKIIRYFDITYRRLNFLKEMLSSKKGFKMRINAKKEYILKMYFGKRDKMTEEESLALKEFTIANSMVNRIADRYHLKPQNFKVDLFRAEEDEEYKLDSTHLGWKKAAKMGVTIHNISGNHLDIVAPPNDKVLARMLQDILDERHVNIKQHSLLLC
jgi:amino acid adenylation domain-containing protein